MDMALLVEKAELHVRRHFARHIGRHLLFHDLEHTLTVTRTAVTIGRASGLSAGELAAVELAALFHDTGYAIKHKGHEAESVRIATAFLRANNAPDTLVRRVAQLIMATELKARPRTRAERVLRDADSAKAGQADFDHRSELLRRELEAVTGKVQEKRAWARENLNYLEHHRFHTAFARDRFGAQKTINLERLRERTALPKERLRSPKTPVYPYVDRDLSWLSFNDRVLQEAKDDRVPLLERIKFLAIYSSNLDEFYRVRVAALQSLVKLGKLDRGALQVTPAKRVERINRRALAQQQQFGKLYRGKLLPALARHGIRILDEQRLDARQREAALVHFRERVRPLLVTAAVREGNAPFIEDRKLYLACRLREKDRGREKLVLVNVPSEEVGRFLLLPSPAGRTDILFLEDAMRLGLPELFTGYKLTACHAIKLSRDADLYLDEEFAGSMAEKVRRSLRKRQTGVPARFLYDSAMPRSMMRGLRELLGLKKQELVPGGRYHHFSDMMKLPVKGHVDLRDKPLRALPHPVLDPARDPFGTIRRQDVMLHFPYHDFDLLVRLVERAARDPQVRRIAFTLYRVAEGSRICEALVEAAKRGKEVFVFVEVQARFDERSNLFWGEALERAGARVVYSYEHLKVHCKLFLIERKEGRAMRRYAYLGTGNFNERTSRIYTDTGLLTAEPRLTEEVAEVFAHLRDRKHRPAVRQLLLAPTGLRSGMEDLVDREIAHALQGRPASIMLKLNSLEDQGLIAKLYDASRAGVKVRLIVRGICCLQAGVPGVSANIEAISIVDRYLEHTRAFVFHNNGAPLVMLSSADWMERNMDRRVEVAFPVHDPALKQEVLHMLEVQWNDNVKARILGPKLANAYRKHRNGARNVQAQTAFHAYLRRKAAH
ncbi:MAG: polyphosphate kinase 1 [Flavobacteriales bacterium]|nr:polyphosphate kinase 1 [Flavobacteriales bacterium]